MPDIVPGTFIEISDTSESTPASEQVKNLLIGVKSAGGSQPANTVVKIVSNSQADELFGRGSQLAQMVAYSRATSPRIDMSAVALADPAGTAATFTLTVTGTATTATQYVFQVGDRRVEVDIATGDVQNDIAVSIDATLGEDEFGDLNVTSGVAVNVVTLTARHTGAYANEIRIRSLSVPPDVIVAIAVGVPGVGAGDVDGALQTLGGTRYNYIALPDADATNLADVKTFLDLRWAANMAIDGHAFAGKRDTLVNLTTLGDGLDDKHLTILGDEFMPTNPWVQGAAVAAARASLTNPNVSLRNVQLTALTAPDESERLDPDDMNTVLVAGITAYDYTLASPRTSRVRTTAKTNDLALASDALRDLTTKLTISTMRQDRIILLGPEIGKILVEDIAAINIDPDVPVTDTRRIRQLLTDQYQNEFLPQAWVRDVTKFVAQLVVIQTSPNSVEFFTFDTINGTLYRIGGTMNFAQAS